MLILGAPYPLTEDLALEATLLRPDADASEPNGARSSPVPVRLARCCAGSLARMASDNARMASLSKSIVLLPGWLLEATDLGLPGVGI